MKLAWGAWRRIALAACCLAMAVALSYAQKQAPATSIQATRSALAQKAQALEARGRPDMALQLWQQILLSDPRNTEALVGEARDYKLMGDAGKADEAIGRLRAVNPRDPNIARLQALSSSQTQNEQLKQAGVLAGQNRPEDAMRIFRQLYGDHPPNGDLALVYYQTLYATKTGKEAAVAGMRELAAKNPGVSQYAIALGAMLTYDPRTRAEGMRILQAHPQDAEAQAALRKALVWNSANPSTAAQLRDYLKSHPQDEEVTRLLKQNEAKLAQMNSGIARNPAEKAAFAALNANRLPEAETRFAGLLAKDAANGRLLAGMGFLRMRQRDFSSAIRYLTQAEAHGYKEKTVQDALANSRFWLVMGEATQAFDGNQFDLAQTRFREALVLNPRSPDALSGLAGVLVRQQQYAQATGIYEQLLRLRPNSADAWRGLFVSYARAGQNDKALATISRFPASLKAAIARDSDYLRTLAGIYEAQGNTAEAQRVLAEALTLPMPGGNVSAQLDTRLQYAGILLQARRYGDAAAQYTQILARNPSSLDAWEGLIAAHHNLGQDAQAIEDVKRMPVSAYESALADPDFLAQLGAIYQQANQYEVAQGLLERAQNQQVAAGHQPGVDLQLQLAAIYLLRNDPVRAYALYNQVLAANPGNPKAWQGLLTALHATNRDSEALQEIAQIPAAVLKQLDANIEFVQLQAGIYAATGNVAAASQSMKVVAAYYARLRQPLPPDVDVQNAWLLYNTGDDRGLYNALMRIGRRTDLAAAQREMVQNIWANWSVRRASAAIDNGNYRRAADILDSALLAFPNNLTVRKAVAGGYVVVGRARDALSLFKTIPMQNASSADFQGAVGAALAANDKGQAELWLREALERYPRDPAILTLAAQYEQARGDNERAAAYYRASLAVMPPVSPVDRLAHILVNPEQDNRPHKAATAADLQRLLNPDDEPFARTTKLPPLPAYGPDPYSGTAPVVLPPSAAPTVNKPASQIQSVPSNDARPLIVPIPNGALSAPRFFNAPVPVSSGGTGAVQAASSVADSASSSSLAARTWKGLIFALVAGGRNAEALQELNKIPADVRAELEADIEFQISVAGLYVAVGDTPRAQPYLVRIDDYFIQHRDAVPAALEIQRAWLLYNLRDDASLYSALLRIDSRIGLTPAQQSEARRLWANWAVRRANEYMDRGNLIRGVEILQAATQDFPGDIGIRRAVAGAYARIGRATDAVALYKAIPMTAASPADLQSAISAALSAGDMAQAESWLHVALARYPNDAQLLSLAARFEQARGNDQRAADFWRAAVNAAPSGAGIQPLPSVLAYPSGAYRAPAPGATRYLLNPGLSSADPQTSSPSLPPPASNQPLSTSAVPQRARWLSQPTANPLPLASVSVYAPPVVASGRGQGTAAPVSPAPRLRSGSSNSASRPLIGRVVLPPSEENVTAVAEEASALDSAQPLVRPALPAESANPAENLRIAAQPMNATAAQAQALFANQTDGQLTQGSAAMIHSVPNAPVQPPSAASPGSSQTQFTVAQYTPSAQEATTGAYSAPRQSAAQPPPQPPQAQSQTAAAKPRPAPARAKRRRAIRAKTAVAASPVSPARTQPQQNPPAAAPTQQSASLEPAIPEQQNSSAAGGAGLSDQELEERSLPPLRGPWVRTQREAPKLNPRDLAEQQLQAIESSYSGWFGGAATMSYRSGASGFSRLGALEAPFEVSLPMGYHARFTVVAKPVFLDSGQAGGDAVMAVEETTATGTQRVLIPEPIGTLTSTNTTPPAQQNAMGVGGEVQFAFPNFAVAGGYTPYGFRVATFTGRLAWKPANGPFTFTAVRDSVKDSELSYSGLRDPAVGLTGAKWGGVVFNQGTMQFSRSDARSGYYFALGGQYLTGYNVRKNSRIDGLAGAYWRAFTSPEYGALNIGVNFFAMHYENNQNAFTYGMGGYFSPQGYFLANVPFTWSGHYETHWHYTITGAIGGQAFQEDSARLWPLAAQNALQYANGNPMLPDLTSVAGNYDLRSLAAYQIGPHWFAGFNFQANNTRNYNFVSAGFFVRYVFREQPSTAAVPTGIFPVDGLRPFNVP